jgi:hypothetical protein
MSWKDLRLSALHTTPVQLAVGGRRGRDSAAEAEV